MSNSKMLIDAAHPEETRVVVLKGNRVEEFDFESASKKQLRGNIYLAKVTRVEPSLQAAFVEYGGNRHGFLAFSEIHPDYYQIPFADRQALLEEEARAHRDEEDEPRESRGGEGRGERGGRRGGGEGRGENRGHRNSEAREPRADKEAVEPGEARSERNARGEGRGDRDGRNERGGRGERGQRRSRRHRRDTAPATALDRRGPADESISEPAFEAEENVAGVEIDGAAAASVGAEGADAPVMDGAADAPGPATSEDAPFERGVEAVGTSGHPAAPADEGDEAVPATAHEGAVWPVSVAADSMLAGSMAAAEPVSDDVSSESEARAEPSADAVTAAAEETYVAAAHADDAPHGEDASGTVAADDAEPEVGSAPTEARGAPDHREDERRPAEGDAPDHEEEHVEQIGGDALSDVAPRPVRLRRHYKIQEVIKRRQILLIQVVKEERGNKGAALTTYLSLAGRYSVLMPNTAKGGGISRKITDGEDRKRLKAIAGELDVPEGMGVILRTAGASRTPVEVRRDFEYLLRMWESVRELTLKSSAPTLVYEEGSLIKRSIRDLYSKEVEEIVVSGEAGFAEARDFMRMLMPGNVRSVQEYRDPQPIFAKSGVEAQLDAMFSAHVTLKSGGYLVINQTEALVAIDVNSGRSTREHNIEDTALRTNMEAADEVARQLRLRDLAGLIVVDFIDMEEGRNNRAVERRIKEALKNDRARIQIGRISHFGLLEMSRQRIRTGVLEGSTVVCPHCAGAGTVRSTSSVALHVLRLVEDALIKDASHDLVVRSRGEVALYMLNQKRAKLVELEQRFGVTVTVEGDPALTGMMYHAIERGELATPAEAPAPRQDLVRVDSIAPIFEPESEIEEAVEAVAEEGEAEGVDEGAEASASEPGDGGERRRKRRRRRRGRDRDGAGEISADAPQPSDDGMAAMAEIGGDLMPEPLPTIGFSAEPSGADEVGTDIVGTHEAEAGPVAVSDDEIRPAADAPEAAPAVAAEPAVPQEAEVVVEEAPKRRRSRRTVARAEEEAAPAVEPEAAVEGTPKRRRRPSRARAAEAEVTEASPAVEAASEAEPVGARPSADRDVGADTVEHHAPAIAAEAPAEPAAATAPVAATVPEPVTAEPESDRPKRSGWWQRAKSSFGA